MRFPRTLGGYAIVTEEIDSERCVGRVYRQGARWIARSRGPNKIYRAGRTRYEAANHLLSALHTKGRA